MFGSCLHHHARHMPKVMQQNKHMPVQKRMHTTKPKSDFLTHFSKKMQLSSNNITIACHHRRQGSQMLAGVSGLMWLSIVCSAADWLAVNALSLLVTVLPTVLPTILTWQCIGIQYVPSIVLHSNFCHAICTCLVHQAARTQCKHFQAAVIRRGATTRSTHCCGLAYTWVLPPGFGYRRMLCGQPLFTTGHKICGGCKKTYMYMQAVLILMLRCNVAGGQTAETVLDLPYKKLCCICLPNHVRPKHLCIGHRCQTSGAWPPLQRPVSCERPTFSYVSCTATLGMNVASGPQSGIGHVVSAETLNVVRGRCVLICKTQLTAAGAIDGSNAHDQGPGVSLSAACRA